jgi:hypothetical protein
MTGEDELRRVLGGLTDALRAKDADLFARLGNLSSSAFWVEWKKVYPEDFPQGGMSLAAASSVIPKA